MLSLRLRQWQSCWLLLLLPRAACVSFSLAPAGETGPSERCISENVPQKSLVAGDWLISALATAANDSAPQPSSSSVRIVRPDGATAFTNAELTGHFAVSALSAGKHRICVQSNASHTRTVTINLKMALEFEDHHTVAKKEHVEAIEAELDRMRKMAVHVYDEMLYMRRRADQQHATNASTRGRLLWVEVVMMFAVLLMGLWQIRYLRNYFKVKKLI